MDTPTTTVVRGPAADVDAPRYLEWGPVIAGAIAAAAIAFVLLTFGTAIGLSVTSPWPNSGARLWVVALAAAWWMVLVDIGSFAAGGYLAGRMRSRWGDSVSDEGQFRDSAHGFMVWALGVVIGALLLAMTGGSAIKTATQAVATTASGSATSGDNRGSNLATAPVDYAVDYLLRPAPATPAGATPAGGADDGALRAEIGRIFAAAVANQELTAQDREYLVQVVARRTGLSQPDAQQRVDTAVNRVRDLEIKARDTADKARKAALIAGFFTAAALLIAAAAAAAAAALGGRHRDEGRSAVWFGHRFW